MWTNANVICEGSLSNWLLDFRVKDTDFNIKILQMARFLIHFALFTLTQVKAMEVLSTVRAMQDEIQDINEQIEKENKKLKVGSSSQNHNVSF